VKELVAFEDDTQRLSYVVEVLPWKDGQLQVRLRDFVLLELNGEDMTTPELEAQARSAVALSALVPVLYVSTDGEFLGVGPTEIDRIVKELGLSAEQAETLSRFGRPTVGEEDRAAAKWRAWVGAWTPWTLAPGEKREATATMHTKAAGDVPVVARSEARNGADGLVQLEQSYSLDQAGVLLHYRSLIEELSKMPTTPGGNPFRGGSEKIVFAATTDLHTLRPQHTRYDDEVQLDFVESGSSTNHQTFEADWDWAHAEGCGR
jgi:hypothetical protein